MTSGNGNPFDATYGQFKDYSTPRLLPKHSARFDRQFWNPAGCTTAMSVLELGCGTGHFLSYLKAKGVADFLGVDHDPRLEAVVPEDLREHFRAADILAFLEAGADGKSYDRVVLFDVLEHFTPENGVALLGAIKTVLGVGGRILVKLPNLASPWGAQYQFGDLTHRAAYTPESLRQLAIAAGLDCTACFADIQGSPVRVFLDRAITGLLARALMDPPEIFSANFLGLLQRPPG